MGKVYFTVSNLFGKEAEAYEAEYSESDYNNEVVLRKDFVDFVQNMEFSCTSLLDRSGNLLGVIADAGLVSEETLRITDVKPRSITFKSRGKTYGYRRVR